ncbi:hypothetical protein QR680_016976 [Steinernema hermaphroditum]|uniref:Uncharacterized protein n=1 Tax=Steinernema hermaphroditum TaxID=289476 RepID=A0AA39HDV0_9BILA|nr:hypothetical protein QR680_016976 [Steinernema hermaphroditum]
MATDWNEKLQVVLHTLKVFAYFVFFLSVGLLQKLVETVSAQLRKINGGKATGVEEPKSEKSDWSEMQSIQTPANMAGIKDPRYQTLHGLPDDIFKRK